MVVGCRVRSGATERRRHLPTCGQREPHVRGPVEVPLLVKKQVGPEELAEVAYDACPRERDRVGEKIELRGHAFAHARHHAPCVLVEHVPD